MGQKLIITEEEKNSILGMYQTTPKKDYVFESVISVDNRYFVFMDEIYDNVERQSRGNIWESIDNFKLIFENVIIDNEPEYMMIRESILSMPILEGVNNLYGLRDYLIQEGFLDKVWGGVKDAGKWVGKQFVDAGKGVYNFAKDTVNGTIDVGKAVLKGDWKKVAELLGKGVLYALRSLKNALYSPIGMAAEAIILGVSAGTAKAVQWIPWALIVGLDLYQLIFNDFPSEEKEDPLWLKFIMLGVDVLGLVFAGAAAKGAKVALGGITKAAKNPSLVRRLINKSPAVKGLLEKMGNAIGKVPGYIQQAINLLKKAGGFGSKVAGFLQKIVNGLSSLITRFKKSIGDLLGKEVGAGGKTVGNLTKKTAGTLGTFYGAEKGGNYVINKMSQKGAVAKTASQPTKSIAASIPDDQLQSTIDNELNNILSQVKSV